MLHGTTGLYYVPGRAASKCTGELHITEWINARLNFNVQIWYSGFRKKLKRDWFTCKIQQIVEEQDRRF